MKSLLLVFLCLLSGAAANPRKKPYKVWWNPVDVIPRLDGYEIIEGDILIPKNRIHGRRNGRDDEFLWKDGIIPYSFDKSFTTEEKNLTLTGMKYLEKKTCIRFVPKEKQEIFARFQKEPIGCSSVVGSDVVPNWIPVNLEAPDCFTEGIIMHELLHITGIFHEHTRPDRDEYVDIHWSNILPEHKESFEKRPESNTFGLPYDYDSIMQYTRDSFSANGKPTITAKSDPDRPLGQMEKPTKEDIEKVNRMYNCKKNLF